MQFLDKAFSNIGPMNHSVFTQVNQLQKSSPPLTDSFWVEDETGDQMITNNGDFYIFITE